MQANPSPTRSENHTPSTRNEDRGINEHIVDVRCQYKMRPWSDFATLLAAITTTAATTPPTATDVTATDDTTNFTTDV